MVIIIQHYLSDADHKKTAYREGGKKSPVKDHTTAIGRIKFTSSPFSGISNDQC